MVTEDSLRAILSRIRYRNCTFACGFGVSRIDNTDGDMVTRMSYWLQVRYPVVEKGVARIARARRWIIEDDASEWQIVTTAFKAIMTVEEHETRESFLFDDVAIFFPHHDLDELVRMRRSEIAARGSSEAEDKNK